jgi:HlyD family type I secretion membrane fusion protein
MSAIVKDGPDDVGVPLRRTAWLSAALMGSLLACGTVVRIGGAVVASGETTTSGGTAQVSHPSGGVLARLLVHEGQRVERNQPLMVLDDGVSSIGARGTGEDLDSMTARRARLEAERDGMASFEIPRELASRTDASAIDAIARERRQLALDRSGDAGRRAQMEERIHQSEQEIASLSVQISAARRQTEIMEPERAGMKTLWDKRLVPLSRYNQLERAAVELDSSAAADQARIAQTRARIAEIRQSMIQIGEDARSRAGAELADLSTRIGDARTRAASASDAQRRTVLRAPSEGVVDSLPYRTPGSMLPAGQPLARIVPDRDRAVVEVSVAPADVDQVRIGQKASLRFSAFSAQTTPQVDGRVERLSADRVVDERTGAAHYVARVRIEPGQMSRLGAAVRPGMPVEAFISTGDRSLLSYLTKPLTDQIARSFTEGD